VILMPSRLVEKVRNIDRFHRSIFRGHRSHVCVHAYHRHTVLDGACGEMSLILHLNGPRVPIRESRQSCQNFHWPENGGTHHRCCYIPTLSIVNAVILILEIIKVEFTLNIIIYRVRESHVIDSMPVETRDVCMCM